MNALFFYLRRMLLSAGLTVAIATGLTLAAQEDPSLWYETEVINPGLGAQPEAVDLSSPRAALRSFVDLAEAGDHDAAAHVLNLSHLREDEQNARAAQIAAKLASIIDRKLRISWSRIPAEADARSTKRANTEKDPQPRRDYLIEELDANGQIFAIRLSRYAVATSDNEPADPVWLFSRDTVDNIDLLYKAFGPRAFEAHIPDAMKARVGWLQLWEWIALPLVAAIVGVVGLLTAKLVGLGRHISENRVARRAFKRAALPLSLVAAAAAAHWLLGFIVSLSGPVNAVITATLVLLAVVGFSLAALRVVDALLDHVTRRQLGENYDTPSSSEREFYTSMYAIRRVILVVTVGFSIVFVLLQFDIFADMGVTLLASAGVLTVILGIAGQVTLGNMVASLQIAIAKPVRIGDNIHYEGDWCVVEAIFFTFIRLRTWDERRLIVPVKYFLSYPFKNWSVLNERLMVTIQLVLDPMAEVTILREKFSSCAKTDPGVIEHDKIWTCITDHSAQGMTIKFYAMAPDPMSAWSVEMRLREEVVDFVRTQHPEWWWRERIEL
ncbi:MAG: mechanosensitive ion channel family protein [Hoeflea sp.]|uniref:mechanosensitive ion channel family protein n=1 Tax=Hoeflea sp. TaxID=1940281 RepID=UPI001DA146DA|nr:mechanosensitive ion channel domain-containing protein [Hoeflea sp.]MBU4530569.1 mechanosensitive ion channel family protein [Alphaproteobacteria bacterium]MBU4542489.1 mechanosensitive ion channel family protein [Alphaproteobacteria bacterium]MBU4552313.1 mechanosensitive ion channel family protein [Alphaproteobacteria bacterium]MBV1726313.1 mechanosensitive ion channel family protein [Hoeflea sp.]MBV1761846.1 mechanosensitive ion channel family protein [Hoeflea sp.]